MIIHSMNGKLYIKIVEENEQASYLIPFSDFAKLAVPEEKFIEDDLLVE